MQFLNPAFFWAFSLIAIPIAIHFFNFQRLKRVSFTNVRWLEEVKQSSQKSKSLKHLLILLSRILALIFLVLAFCQPLIPPDQSIASSEDLTKVFVFDNSYSMDIENGRESNLDLAKDHILEVLGKSDFGYGEMFLVEGGFLPKDDFPYQKEALVNRLVELDLSLSSPNSSNLLSKAQSRGDLKEAKQIWFISDFQRSLGVEESISSLDSNSSYIFLPIQPQTRLNFFVDTLFLEKPFIELGNSFKVKGLLKGSGDVIGSEVNLRLLVNENQRASKTILFESDGPYDFEFELSFERPGPHRCKIVLDDPEVSIDNEFNFVLNPISDINVLQLGTRENQYLSALFSSEGSFSHSFSPLSAPELQKLESSDLVFIEDGLSINNIPLNSIQEFVESGGHLVLVPGQDSLSNGFRNVLQKFGIRQTRVSSFESERLSPIEMEDPFFEGVFEDDNERMDLPEIQVVGRYTGWQRSLLKQRDGDQVLCFSNWGQGRVYFFGSPLDDAYGNFVKHSLFVPVIFRMGAFSQGTKNSSLFRRFDDKSFSMGLPGVKGNQLLKLKGEGTTIIPDQRRQGRSVFFNLEESILSPGFYELIQEDSILGLLALNPSQKESDLDYLSLEEIKSMESNASNIRVFDSEDPKELAKDYSSTYVGKPLWKYCLIFALLFLILEAIFIRIL